MTKFPVTIMFNVIVDHDEDVRLSLLGLYTRDGIARAAIEELKQGALTPFESKWTGQLFAVVDRRNSDGYSWVNGEQADQGDVITWVQFTIEIQAIQGI